MSLQGNRGIVGVDAPQWYVVQTKGGKEILAEANLKRQGYGVVCPTFQKQVRHARKIEYRSKALFPGYVFLRMEAARQEWYPVNSTIGVTRIVTFGGRPAPLPEGFVERLSEWTNKQGAISFPPPFSTGDNVRVMAGAFDSWIGKVVGLQDQERVTLLIDLLGRKVPLTVDSAQLRKVS